MSDFYVVVENLEDWSPYHPSDDVISFNDYLHHAPKPGSSKIRIINLSRNYSYLSTGYYCALLAEARGHQVLPSVSTLNDVGRRSLTLLQIEKIEKCLSRLEAVPDGQSQTFHCWFGYCLQSDLLPVAREVFERFPCPILEITINYNQQWKIQRIKPVSLNQLKTPEEQESFANAFEKFSNKLWRKPKARKTYRYDLAILTDPEEAMPPSDKKALAKFVKAAKHLGIAADFIGRKDYTRLPEYDGLFIRETTSVDNHTYRFAKKAEAEGLVVLDDSTSILRCTNKIYLADLLKTHKISTPRTEILSSTSNDVLDDLATKLGFPIVLKIPDGSFSKGILKARNRTELKKFSKELRKKSSLLLAQEFLYTDYDWRIGILNNKPLYACRYYMVSDHWQIYHHGTQGVESGDFDTLPTFEVPKAVLELASNATRLIGDGFYGVDLKQSDKGVVVIEINDNPSIDSDVEDKYLGDQLYTEIMEEFLRRMKARRI